MNEIEEQIKAYAQNIDSLIESLNKNNIETAVELSRGLPNILHEIHKSMSQLKPKEREAYNQMISELNLRYAKAVELSLERGLAELTLAKMFEELQKYGVRK